MGATQEQYLSKFESPGIAQQNAALISGIGIAFKSALILVVIGLILSLFITNMKKRQGERFMFKVNDYVVYGLTGVCQIADISKDEYIGSNETEYYVLNPVYINNMTIKIPVNNLNTVIRAISTKDDVLSIIAMMSETKTVWIDDDKQRVNNYKAALKTGKIEEWVKIIKTLYQEKEAKSVDGKKLRKTDEDILNTAEKYLNEEFAIALNISPDEVVDYIHEHIS